MPDDLIRRSDAKAAMINLVLHVLKPNVIGPWERHIEEALASVPAAGAGLDPAEVKAVLAEALSSQPMAKVWAEAAINAMCGITAADLTSRPDAAKE